MDLYFAEEVVDHLLVLSRFLDRLGLELLHLAQHTHHAQHTQHTQVTLGLDFSFPGGESVAVEQPIMGPGAE